MTTIKHFEPLNPSKAVFAIALLLLSCYVLYSGSWFGLILFAAALKLGLREGIELDLEKRRFRKVYGILQITFGTWKNLPEIEYVSVFKTTKKSRARVIAAEGYHVFEVYKVNLFYQRNKHIEAFVGETKEKAFSVGKHISDLLAVELHDVT